MSGFSSYETLPDMEQHLLQTASAQNPVQKQGKGAVIFTHTVEENNHLYDWTT